MSLNEISNALKIIKNLFSNDNETFADYNIQVFQKFFQAKNIPYEIIPPDKDNPNHYRLFYWDEHDRGAEYVVKITNCSLEK